jgi:hypothetical protein
MIPKLNTVAFVIRFLKQLLNLEALKKAYFSFAHSILSYGIIFREVRVTVKSYSKFKKEL